MPVMKVNFSKEDREIVAIEAAQKFAKFMRQWALASWKNYCIDFDFCLSKNLEELQK